MSCQTGSKAGGDIGSHLLDPYIALTNFTVADTQSFGTRAVFRDLYPFIANQHYRYQIVYFDKNGEIAGYRKTNWIQAL